MKNYLVCFLTLIALVITPVFAKGDLVVIDTDQSGFTAAVDNNADDIADTGSTTGSYSQAFTTSGVTYTVNFNVGSIGGFLSGTTADLGVWSNVNAESDGGEVSSFNAGEGLIVDNVTISGVSGGTALFDSITRVGFRFATAGGDEGEFTVGGTSLPWSTLVGSATNNLDSDGGSDQNFAIQTANGGTAVSQFQLDHVGGAWRLDALEFNVLTAVPEPTSFLMFGLVAGGLGFRRRKT